MPKAIRTYAAFWPHYLAEHGRPATRTIHVVGTAVGLAVLVAAVALQLWWLLAVALACGYAFAWVAHMAVERNRPTTFTYPLWSFVSDLRMFALYCSGRLEDEIRRYQGAGE